MILSKLTIDIFNIDIDEEYNANGDYMGETMIIKAKPKKFDSPNFPLIYNWLTGRYPVSTETQVVRAMVVELYAHLMNTIKLLSTLPYLSDKNDDDDLEGYA